MPDPSPAPLALVIDDEPQMRRLLRTLLEADGLRVLDAATAGEGLILAAQKPPALVLLDLGLPDMDGVEALHRLREWCRAPVLILSVRDADDQKVQALDGGADDYVTKPFSAAELSARVRVLLRRAQVAGGAGEGSIWESGPLRVDLAARTVAVNGAEVRLTATEWSMLALFVRHAGRVLTHRQILREVWGPNAEEHRQYLRVYMAHLRRKIEGDGPPRLLRTEPGIGYRLVMAESMK